MILKTIMGSPFLIFLTVIVALERLVPDITNYLFSVAASAAYKGDPYGMAQMFANVNFYTSLASFTASSLLVGLTLRKIGTGGSLMTAGLVNLALFALYPFAPTLGVAAVFFGLDGVTRYTWFKTAKESTYSATDRDVIYRVKAFIEMFVYRLARGLADEFCLNHITLAGPVDVRKLVFEELRGHHAVFSIRRLCHVREGKYREWVAVLQVVSGARRYSLGYRSRSQRERSLAIRPRSVAPGDHPARSAS